MTAEEYQKKAHTFAQHNNIVYPYLGLAEEAGEVCGKMAKYIRSHGGMFPLVATSHGDPDVMKLREDISKELGDCMWMMAEICTLLDIPLEKVMEDNISKLEDRKARGVINGSGDNR